MSDAFAGQVAVVTGASRGIGREIARALGQEGVRIVVNYAHQQAAAEGIVAQLQEAGTEAIAIRADVSQPAEASALIHAATQRFGRLDILVNNAGITRDGLLLRMKDEDWYDVLHTDLSSAFFCLRAAARPMIRQRYGRVINVASIAGVMGNAGQTNYAAAKAGMIGLTKAAARELADRGITVNAVAPGFIETEMTEELTPEQRERAASQIPVRALGKTADVARAVVFLADPQQAYVTGQVLHVDGGLAM